MKIIVNGTEYTLNGPADLSAMRAEHWHDWYSIRTANSTLLNWALELYMDELDRQDEPTDEHRGSTGSYGKLKEVTERVQRAISTGSKMYLHDVKARPPKLDDQRIGSTRIEHKTGFAQWAYGASADECWAKLNRMATAGIEIHWDPFKDECEIVMPLAQLLEYLSEYSPSKGLSAWFHFVGVVKYNGGFRAVKQLQLQPVKNSYKRYQYIAQLVAQQNPGYEIVSKDQYRSND